MEQTIEKLLHHEFDRKTRGYNRDQVDDFLDEVIEDIEKLQTKYRLLLDEKKILEKNNFELKMKMLDMKSKLEEAEASYQQALQAQSSNQQAVHAMNAQNEYEAIQKKALLEQQQQRIQQQRLREAEAMGITPQVDAPTQTAAPADTAGQAITHEDSKADDHTLQQRIEQLEREINNIKSFTE
ncbi:DivIVA domain-containing protein [Mollicutes bacterium LVI A0039]|nr:DivIVA domain-containing protein [Mollicutes bacterium LVI A0039]